AGCHTNCLAHASPPASLLVPAPARMDEFMPQRPTLLCPRGMVVAEHYLAAEAGLRMLHAGGNAVDAAVAATLVEGVVNHHMHTLRGVLSALVYTAHDRRVLAVNGNTKAPRAATIEAFRDRG